VALKASGSTSYSHSSSESRSESSSRTAHAEAFAVIDEAVGDAKIPAKYGEIRACDGMARLL
jgi:hypothetical protein